MITLAQVIWDLHMHLMDYSWPGWERIFEEVQLSTCPIAIWQAHDFAADRKNEQLANGTFVK